APSREGMVNAAVERTAMNVREINCMRDPGDFSDLSSYSEQQRKPSALSRLPRSRPLSTPQRRLSSSLWREPPRRGHSVFAAPPMLSQESLHSHTLPLMSNSPGAPPSQRAIDPPGRRAPIPESSPLQAVPR